MGWDMRNPGDAKRTLLLMLATGRLVEQNEYEELLNPEIYAYNPASQTSRPVEVAATSKFGS